jgi:glycosyltransferase involved in cell wall biosynthesis
VAQASKAAIIKPLTLQPSLSIIVPAYNEEKRLPPTLAAIATYLTGSSFSDAEIVVVDDGSRDGTPQIVEEFAREHKCVRLLRNPGNRGKGYSVRHGMLEARGEWLLFSDADLSAPIDELPKLLEGARVHKAQVAIGSRALDRSLIGVRQSRTRELLGIFFNRAMRFLTGLPFADTQCGFKLYHRDAARIIFARQLLDGFGFDVEDLYIARVHGIPTVEVPVRWNNVEGTKVSLGHGARSFSDLLVVRRNHLMGRYR